MSALSEKIRTALYAKLNVTGVTGLAIGGVHFRVAPANRNGVQTAFPFVVFDRVPGGVDYALGNNLIGERDLWMVKAVTDEDSSKTLSPPELAELILQACEAAIGGTLTISGGTVSIARRQNDIPPMLDDQSDRQVWQHGFFLEVYAG